MLELRKVVDVSLAVALGIFVVLLIVMFSLDDRSLVLRPAKALVIFWLVSVLAGFFWAIIRGRTR